jgi:voltage-gated potassium channel
MLQLLIASLMVAVTVLMHLLGLGLLVALIRRHGHRLDGEKILIHQLWIILSAAFGLFALHSAEIWLYAIFYALVGALPDFADALYFSTSTYSTVGYGDVVLPKGWRLVGAIEAANGIILLGWSTAFFVSVIDRIRLFERAALKGD